MLDFSLYWIKPQAKPLMVVAAASEHHAASLFNISQRQLKRYGGAWNPTATLAPIEIHGIYPVALKKPGVIFEHLGQWRRSKHLPRSTRVSPTRAEPLSKASQTGHVVLGVRTLRLTPEEKTLFVNAGGGRWLKKEIRAAQDQDAIIPTRGKGPSTQPVSFRISDSDWERFQQLGGKTWMLIRLASWSESL